MKVSAREFKSGAVAVLVLLSACAPGEPKEAGLGPEPTPELTAVTVAPAAVTLAAGAAQTFSVSGTLDDGETITPPVTWSANSGIITSNGSYTAPAVPGTYRVIASVVGDNLSDTSTVTVPTAPVTLSALTLTPSTVSLQSGGSQQFSINALWSDGGTTLPSVSFSATGGTVDGNGLFVAGGTPGSFRVIVSHNGGTLKDTATVTIQAPPAVTLTNLILVPGSVTLQTDASQQFAVAGTWSDGSTATPVVTWTATGGTVDASGEYTAGATAGSYRVIARHVASGRADTSAVTVTAPPAATLNTLSLTPASVSLNTGTTQQFSIAAQWSDGATTLPAVSYSATGGTISAGGLYTAGSTGGTFRVIVTHAASGLADTSSVTLSVPAATLTSLSMTPASSSLISGSTQQFSTAAQWSDGGTTVPTLTYSATGGTVSQGGLYTAGSTAGTYRVIVSANGRADTSSVTISLPTLTSLSMTPASVSLTSGATQQFSTTAQWSDGGTSVPTLTYSATGGSESQGGLYTAGSTAGTYRVIVSANGRADTSAVTITVPTATLTSLVMTPASVSLTTGGSQLFAVAALWSDGGTTIPAVSFTATGGTVLPNGQYTAGSTAGTFRVIVSANGRADTSAITISAPAATLTSLTLTPGSVTLNTGATQQFSTAALWSDGGTTPPTLSYTATGGTVSASGLYTAGSTGGTYRVIVSGGGRADTSSVSLTSPTATIASVSITPASVSLLTGATQLFSATATMSDGSTVTNPPLTWTATGGLIDLGQLFVAGLVAGNFRVIATSANGHADTSTVTLSLLPTGGNNMYFNSAESGCGSDGNSLMCDDFEDGDWYSKDCDAANGSGGLLQTDGWCGNIYANPITPAKAVVCGSQGYHSDCAATQGATSGSAGGRNMADHSLSTPVKEMYVRFYTRPQPGYQFGAEKLLTVNKDPAGVGGIYWGNLHINCGGGGGGSSGTLSWQPVAPAPDGCKPIMTMTAGHWYFIELHMNVSTGVLQVWADDCGDGTGCTGTPTLRLNLTGWQYPSTSNNIASLWFENWANPGSVGTRLLDQIKVSKVGPIGFAN